VREHQVRAELRVRGDEIASTLGATWVEIKFA